MRRIPVERKFWHTGSALLAHVAIIVCYCAQKEMRGIDTRANIATMEHVHSFGDVTVLEFP